MVFVRWCMLSIVIMMVSAGLFEARAETFQSKRADGSVIRWYLDRPDGTAQSGLIVLIQGSGCLPALKNRNLKVVRTAFPQFSALMVEKYGVEPGDDPKKESGYTDCSRIFREQYTATQSAGDYAQIINELRTQPWWNGQLMLFGGSEGGLVAAILARHVNPNAAILLSSAGGVPFGEFVKLSIPEEGRAGADAAFETARRNPQSSELWAGFSYRFWADIIDRRVVDDMLQSEAAFLAIDGGRDSLAQMNSARIRNDFYAKAGRCNLTSWEFPANDHTMIDSDGRENLPMILAQSAAWVGQQLHSQDNRQCMKLK